MTGNVACGKSSVGEFLQAFSFPVLDSDFIVHEILSKNIRIIRQISDLCFPDNVLREKNNLLSGIDRKILGKILFSDSHKKLQVEKIIHPEVKELTEKFFEEQEKLKNKLAFNLIPLLYEIEFQNNYDKVILVFCDPEIQKERFKSRNPELTDLEISQRINSQISQEKKLKLADFVVNNSGTFESTRIQVEKILKILK